MLIFTAEGARQLHSEFDKVCEEFAKKNNLVYNKSRLTYSDSLKISSSFSIAENIDEAWNVMVTHFKTKYQIDLKKGIAFVSGRKRYTITGEMNPNKKSRFRIGATEYENSLSSSTYFDVEYLAKILRDQKGLL